jgi:hypothetical protein
MWLMTWDREWMGGQQLVNDQQRAEMIVHTIARAMPDFRIQVQPVMGYTVADSDRSRSRRRLPDRRGS